MNDNPLVMVCQIYNRLPLYFSYLLQKSVFPLKSEIMLEIEMNEEKKFWTTKEVADSLDLNESTIRRWIVEGKIKAGRTLSKRGKYMISSEEVEKLEKLLGGVQ
jgi:excisionase family DNA binding protein